ncbi:MAG: hypothetical protein LBC59_08685 [Chitinispirillales bacterium]|nr:hypothetical protein [Chitinispirillales bacterium]
MCNNKLTIIPNGDESDFYKQIADLLAVARQYAKRQLDSAIVTAYYEIGRMIVEREQHGQKRAHYGAKVDKGVVRIPHRAVRSWFFGSKFEKYKKILPSLRAINRADAVCPF